MRRRTRAWLALLAIAPAAAAWTADSRADPPIETASRAERLVAAAPMPERPAVPEANEARSTRTPLSVGNAQRRRAAQAAWPQTGHATYYHDGLHGQRTSSGERYDRNGLTAAHRTLPLGTLVRVTNLFNLRSVLVRVNDRGPFARGRSIDLSRAAAVRLGYVARGSAPVAIEVVDKPAGVPAAARGPSGDATY